jgi:hypothetical protein
MSESIPRSLRSRVRQRMERVQIDESGQRCGGTVPMLGAA